jgi:hypothetical protein
MENITISQIKKALDSFDFIILRERNGFRFGINCRIIKLKTVQNILLSKHGNKKTRFISFTPCSFQEYINYKAPFVVS